MDEAVGLVQVGDREAEIYDLFVQPRRSFSELLSSAAHNRQVQPELDDLIPTLEQAPVLGQQRIALERKESPRRPECDLNGAWDASHD